MIRRPPGVGAFEFVVMSSQRAAQLMRGCRPKIETIHKNTITAQLEVAQGSISPQAGSASDRAQRDGIVD